MGGSPKPGIYVACRLATGTTVAQQPEPRPQPVAQGPQPRCPALAPRLARPLPPQRSPQGHNMPLTCKNRWAQ
jgi:hypothetical protein